MKLAKKKMPRLVAKRHTQITSLESVIGSFRITAEAYVEQSCTHSAHLLQAVLKEAFAPAKS